MPVSYLHLPYGQAPPDIGQKQPFRAVVVLQQATSPEWRTIVSEWLVQSGCLYMMAWGPDCSAWDDSVDWANIDAFDGGDIPDDRRVMTTWHADEPLSEVFWFAENAARHPTIPLDETTIIDIGPQDRRAVLTDMFTAAQQ